MASSSKHADTARAELIGRAEALVKAHMAQYDPSHDWAHVDRVRKTAMRIARSLNPEPDLLVVELAALFHDMADGMSAPYSSTAPLTTATPPTRYLPTDSPSTDKPTRPAKYTSTSSLPTLLSPFFTHPSTSSVLLPSQVTLITRIIPSVSWTAEARQRAAPGEYTRWHETCPELCAVQDADRLDAIGAVGVMRCAAFSGVKGRKLVDDADTNGGGSAEAHFEEKLLKIKGRMKTDFGRAEAERRHQTMVNFLEALESERRTWTDE
ncbi:hypothetical protein EHS25_001053 [Saitozyma podzolica]|uniref:HD/PDEase domain-containing protein n=1 Tax=Saitozyma podzolica TaxID=1890683 RepID=A0A427YH84_9TREE|nr:hypothetical protein EHS25_001053 [Saitozyma podzolica]